MKLAEASKIAAETAQTTATTSKKLDEIQTASTTAQEEAQKAKAAADIAKNEKVNAENAKDEAITAAANAGSKMAVAQRYVEAATNSTQNAADDATKAEEYAKTAAVAAKTAADKALEEGNQPKDPEVKDPPTSTPDPLLAITPNNSIISTTLKPVNESEEVISESNPEIFTDKTVDTTSEENNSGNAVTMSTIGFISCLIFYSLINQLDVPASVF